MRLDGFPADWIAAMEARDDTARVLQNLRDDACIERHEAALRDGVSAAWAAKATKATKTSQDAIDALKAAVKAKGLHLQGHPTPADVFERLVRVVLPRLLAAQDEKFKERCGLDSEDLQGSGSTPALKQAIASAFEATHIKPREETPVFCVDAKDYEARAPTNPAEAADLLAINFYRTRTALVVLTYRRSEDLKLFQPTTLDAWNHGEFLPSKPGSCNRGWGVTDYKGGGGGVREAVHAAEVVELERKPDVI